MLINRTSVSTKRSDSGFDGFGNGAGLLSSIVV